MINYCVNVVDKVVEGHKTTVAGQEPGLDTDVKLRSRIYSDEVKVRGSFILFDHSLTSMYSVTKFITN